MMPLTEEPPLFFPDDAESDEFPRKISLIVRELLKGKSNNTFSITLTPDSTETIILRERVSIDTFVLMNPRTASAAVAQAIMYTVTTKGVITITHDSQPDTDRTFGAVLVG